MQYNHVISYKLYDTVRTGLEGPGLTIAQKIWYCVATVGGQYIWARLQSFSAFRRWGDSEQVLYFLSIHVASLQSNGEKARKIIQLC